jgi:hypothetical protein
VLLKSSEELQISSLVPFQRSRRQFGSKSKSLAVGKPPTEEEQRSINSTFVHDPLKSFEKSNQRCRLPDLGSSQDKL